MGYYFRDMKIQSRRQYPGAGLSEGAPSHPPNDNCFTDEATSNRDIYGISKILHEYWRGKPS
jgi:hypothetical protein